MIENIETGDFVDMKEKSLNACEGTSLRVADFGTKNVNSTV